MILVSDVTAVSTHNLQPALHTHGLVAVRGVGLETVDDVVSLVRCFGDAILPTGSTQSLAQLYVSKSRPDGAASAAAQGSDFWHSDNAYNPEPAAATALYCLEMPASGGTATWLADSRRAYEALGSDTVAAVSSLLAEHVSGSSTSPCSSLHPLIRAHPHTGAPSLYINPLYTKRLYTSTGEPLPTDESDRLIRYLCEHMLGSTCREPAASSDGDWANGASSGNLVGGFAGRFDWHGPGDLLVWDNARCV
jgi:alpha-ketoglutarate-dependent taurine dioxygenase